MARVSISEAARLTGKGRSTLYRHIENSRLSAEKDADGNPVIDTSELFRVYGPLKHDTVSQQDKLVHRENPKSDNQDSLLQVEIRMLRERLAELTADKDSVIADLRQRLDAEAEERRRLTMMLTDQRPKQPEAMPAPLQEAQESRLTRVWKILTGKT